MATRTALSLVTVGLATLGILASAARAQDQQDPEPTRVDDIVVLGTPLREQVRDFVGAVTLPPRGRGPARWNERAGVCVGVANLRTEAAQYMADRISAIAVLLDMPVGEPGCRPNVLVMLTDEAPALAAALVDRSPNAFRPDYAGAAGTVRQLNEFIASDRPVRWWHVAMPVTESGTPAVRLPGDSEPRFIRGVASRITTTLRNELRRAFVIVDVDQVEHLTLTQLSDYVAMVAFAQIDPDHEVTEFPSILNVVAHPTAASEMTDWDRAYLEALYGVELNRRNPNSQLGQVASSMYRDRRETDEAEREPDSPN
jgi:hypothetical protein